MTSNTTPLVSVLMPFYNAGSDFKTALQSILNQTYTNWELLLCDDASTDDSLEVARSIRDERVIVWSSGKNKGLAGRLNECIDRARGQFIARMDSDDVSYPERFRSQVEFLQSHPEIDLVGCNMLICGEDGAPLGKRSLPLEHEQIIAHPVVGFPMAHPTWMARGEWYRHYRYDPSAIRFEDAELLYRSHKSSRFANLPDLLYGYRELRGGFRKRVKSRIGRVRYLNSRHDAAGRWNAYSAAAVESLKLVSDAALVAVSARYAIMRRREERLSDSEGALWRNVFAAANGNKTELAIS
jgi:glycosyltransferase involved in cell wall biosynthesis